MNEEKKISLNVDLKVPNSMYEELFYVKRDEVNVKKFGAIGDGKNDDTKSIQRALDYSNDNGVSIYFPNGKYILTDSLYLGDFASIVGGNKVKTGINEFNWSNNKNDVVIITETNIVFKSKYKDESKLNDVKLSIVGVCFQNNERDVKGETIFLYKFNLRGSNVKENMIRGYSIFLLGAISYISTLEKNVFFDCRRNFMKSKNIEGLLEKYPAAITDSTINENYINGSQYAKEMVAFDIHYPNYSSIKGNFIDFFKIGLDISGGQGLHIINNDIQYCGVGIKLNKASNISISSNRFGLMNKGTHDKQWEKRGIDTTEFGDVDGWHGILLNGSVGDLLINDNLGMTVDNLITVEGYGYRNVDIYGNNGGKKTINLRNLGDYKNNNDFENVFIRDTTKEKYNKQPYDLLGRTFPGHKINYKGIELFNNGKERLFKTLVDDYYCYSEDIYQCLKLKVPNSMFEVKGNDLIINKSNKNWVHAYSDDIEVGEDNSYLLINECNIKYNNTTEIWVIFKDENDKEIGNKTKIYTNGDSKLDIPIGCKKITIDFTTNESGKDVVFKKPIIKLLK